MKETTQRPKGFLSNTVIAISPIHGFGLFAKTDLDPETEIIQDTYWTFNDITNDIVDGWIVQAKKIGLGKSSPVSYVYAHLHTQRRDGIRIYSEPNRFTISLFREWMINHDQNPNCIYDEKTQKIITSVQVLKNQELTIDYRTCPLFHYMNDFEWPKKSAWR